LRDCSPRSCTDSDNDRFKDKSLLLLKLKRAMIRLIKFLLIVLLLWERLSVWWRKAAVSSHALALRTGQAHRQWPPAAVAYRRYYPRWWRALLLLVRRC
jgi:hypothetical protein